MKTAQKKKARPVRKKEESSIRQLRNIRDKIGVEIKDMSFEELKKTQMKKQDSFQKRFGKKKTNHSK